METMEIIYLPVTQVQEQEGFNIRYEYGELQELKQSIVSEGLKNPIQCKRVNKIYILTDGHRRYRAMMIAVKEGVKLPKIPVRIEPKNYTQEERTMDMVLLNQGKPLTVLEEAFVYQRGVKDYSWTVYDIAEKTGRKKSHIHNLLLLANADKRIHDLIIADKISASTAMRVVTVYKDNPELQFQEFSNAMSETILQGGTKIKKKNLQIVKLKNPFLKTKEFIERINVELTCKAIKLNAGEQKVFTLFEQIISNTITVNEAIKQLKP